MNDKETKDFAIQMFNAIRVYCETASAGGHRAEILEALNYEFEPIIDRCQMAVKAIRGEE